VGFPDRQGRSAPLGMGDQRCTITRIGPAALPIRCQYNYAELVQQTSEAFHCGEEYFVERAPTVAAQRTALRRTTRGTKA
jgi:hypothetical protein